MSKEERQYNLWKFQAVAWNGKDHEEIDMPILCLIKKSEKVRICGNCQYWSGQCKKNTPNKIAVDDACELWEKRGFYMEGKNQ